MAIQIALAGDMEPNGANGYVFEEIAEKLLALGLTDESRVWFGKAFAVFSSDARFVETESIRLDRMHRHSESGPGEDHI